MRVLFLVLLFCVSGYAQVPTDFDDANECTTSGGGGPFSCTFNITVASNSDRFLVVSLAQNATTSQENGCAYNGDAMTKIASISGPSVTIFMDVFTLDDPDVGTHSVVCGLDTDIGVSIGAWVTYNAGGVRGFHTDNNDGMNEDPINFTATTEDTDAVAMFSAVRSTTCENTQTGYSILYDDKQIGGTGRRHCAIRTNATGTSTLMSLNLAAGAVHASVVVVIEAADASTTGGAYQRLQNRRRR